MGSDSYLPLENSGQSVIDQYLPYRFLRGQPLKLYTLKASEDFASRSCTNLPPLTNVWKIRRPYGVIFSRLPKDRAFQRGLGVSSLTKFSNWRLQSAFFSTCRHETCQKNRPPKSVKRQVFSVLIFYKCLFPRFC